MTFACLGDGEPLYWKPLLLSIRRSTRLRSVRQQQQQQRVVLLLFLLVSHCACGTTALLAGPERSMVTGDKTSNRNTDNNNHNNIQQQQQPNNRLHNRIIHSPNGNGHSRLLQQQQHSQLRQHQQQRHQYHSQQQETFLHLQQQLHQSLQPQSHYHYYQFKQPQSQSQSLSQTSSHSQQQQQQQQQQHTSYNHHQDLQQQQHQLHLSKRQQQHQQQQENHQQQQQQSPSPPPPPSLEYTQRHRRQDSNSNNNNNSNKCSAIDVRSRFWPADVRETCNATTNLPPSTGESAPAGTKLPAVVVAPSEEAPSQCLQVDQKVGETICNKQVKERNRTMRKARLAFCDSYLVYNLIEVREECKRRSLVQLPETDCLDRYEMLDRLDAEVSDNYAVFEEMLSRYDCETTFSTHWNCSHCKEAYKQWLCSMAFRYHTDRGEEVPPCRTYCEQVETRCPYFLPELHNQYAGEPAFLCNDSVRERQTGEGRCYKPCETNNHEICIQNATHTTVTDNSSSNKDAPDSRTPLNVTSGHNNATSRARGERSRSSVAKRLQGSVETLWLSLAAHLGLVLWSTRTLCQYWVIGLT